MYPLEPTADYVKRLKKWSKRHRQETLGMLNNVDTVQKALRDGARVQDLQFGFLHHEPRGVKAVDQGGGSGLRESRLYLFVDEEEQVVRLLTIGDKDSQREDIANCTHYVEALNNER